MSRFASLLLLFISISNAQTPGRQEGRTLLPNGWWLSPHGKQIGLDDFPIDAALSPDEKFLAVAHAGNSQPTLVLVNLTSDSVVQRIELSDAWFGMKFAGKILSLSGRNKNLVYQFELAGGSLLARDTIRFDVGKKPFDGGVAGIDVRKNVLAAVLQGDSTLRYFNLKNKFEMKIKLDGMPYSCKYLPDDRIAVSLWNAKKIQIFRGSHSQAEIPVGDHPNEIAISLDGKWGFVACSGDNSVSVVSFEKNKHLSSVNCALYPDSPEGSTTDAVCLTSDGKHLLAANADNNSLTIISLKNPQRPMPVGFIPVGWYPTKVFVTKENRVLVVNGKGGQSFANPKGEYIGQLMRGSLSLFQFPTNQELLKLNEHVYENTPYEPYQLNETRVTEPSPIPRKIGEPSPIKYLFYLIKENRTYDQVFGDVKEGNGDTSLCLFGETITPNHHKLAREFALFDNLYVNASVSADGHAWSNAAYSNEYIEKIWPGEYAGRGWRYDYDGLEPASISPSGFIWDLCKKFGVSYRSYGEFTDPGKSANDPSTAYLPSLKGHIAPGYRGWDLDYSDIDRANAWMNEFDEFEKNGGLPRFNIFTLPNDHTSGTSKGKLTPQAYVAQNDLALGMIVERISKSKFWNESAIFVIEDDAQDGPDHVDAHRTVGLVISPYTKRKFVDHTFYTTTSMLRTMELILGLPPMSQYDAASTPMFNSFTMNPDTTRYTLEQPRYDITKRNPSGSYGEDLMERMNLRRVDAAPDRLFSEIIWRAVKGTPMPAPKYSIFSVGSDEAEEGNKDEE
jgi:hypothetical protein